jgi:hypothetical protein
VKFEAHVHSHVRTIYRKLGTSSRAQTVERACATGLLPTPLGRSMDGAGRSPVPRDDLVADEHPLAVTDDRPDRVLGDVCAALPVAQRELIVRPVLTLPGGVIVVKSTTVGTSNAAPAPPARHNQSSSSDSAKSSFNTDLTIMSRVRGCEPRQRAALRAREDAGIRECREGAACARLTGVVPWRRHLVDAETLAVTTWMRTWPGLFPGGSAGAPGVVRRSLVQVQSPIAPCEAL